MKKRKWILLGASIAVIVVLSIYIASISSAATPWKSGGLFCWDGAVLTDEDERESLWQTMEDLRLNVLYQAVSKGTEAAAVRTFLAAAAEQGIEVWMLTGAPEWGLDRSGAEMIRAVEEAARYNQGQCSEECFRGILMDCEPYLLEQWEREPAAVMDSWLSAMKEAHQAAESQTLDFTVCIPYYLDTEGFSGHLRELTEEGCSGLAIMNYYKEEEAAHVQTEVAFARASGIPVTVIYELQPPDAHSLQEINTYYHEGLHAVEESWQALKEIFGKDGFTPALHEYEALREVACYE